MGLNKKLITTGEAAAAGIVGTDHFDIATYTGDGSSYSETSFSFEPGLVWMKKRDDTFASDHFLYDSVRGNNKFLFPNLTATEGTSTLYFTSFDSNGFTVPNNAYTNSSGNDFVAWAWKSGAAVSGTGTGTISNIQVSANTAAGFSIVDYTASGQHSVSHGLDQAPELILTKLTNLDSNWLVYNSTVGTNKYLSLNTASQATASAGVFSAVGASTFTNYVSDNSRDFVNYCFHSVDGYQKIGSYTGSGSAGNKQTTDFQPRFLLIKRTDSSSGGAWFMFDSARSTSDPRNHLLRANASNAEDTSTSGVDFETDGFSFNSNDFNESSPATYIYLAIA